MDDGKIIDLFWNRSEDAVKEGNDRYGSYLRAIVSRILHDVRDCEECVNDIWFLVWNRIPPERPVHLSAWLAKITRNHAISMWRRKHSDKRGGGTVCAALDEMAELIPGENDMEKQLIDRVVLGDVLNRFLEKQTREKRVIFVKRYFYLCSMEEIASDCGISISKVKTTLFRMRKELAVVLESEGIWS